MKYSSSIRATLGVVWLLGVLAIVPTSRAQDDDEASKALKKIINNASKALESPSPSRQVAGLSLLPNLKLTPAQSREFIAKLVDFAPKSSNEEVQIAWLLAYGRLHLRPEDNSNDQNWPIEYRKFPSAKDSAERLKPFLTSGSLKIRQAAAESLGYLVIAAIQRLDKPGRGGLSDREGDGDVALATGLGIHPVAPIYPFLDLFDGDISRFDADLDPYLPLIKNVLESPDTVTLKWGLDIVRNLATAVGDNLPDPTIRRDRDFSVKPLQAKIKFLIFEPVLKKLDQLTPGLQGSLRASDPQVLQMGHRTAEAVANARRLARISQEIEPIPGSRVIPTTEEDLLLPGLQTLLPTLFSNLKAADPALRLSAMEALENYDRTIWNERQQIIAATTDSSAFVRWVAARALGKMLPKNPQGNEQRAALAGLSRLLTDTDIDVRLAALVALQRWGNAAVEVSEGVISCINRGDVDARLTAIATLESLKSEPNRATAVLVSALSQEDFRIRRAAASTLGRMGEKAKAAVPALEKVLNDPDPELRRIAGEAILAID